MKLLSGDELASYENFTGKLLLADAAFRSFRQQQTELGGAITAKDKAELQKTLKALEEVLNGHLASEYGVKLSEKKALATWVKSDQPFHWFIEFYGTISSGGFDAIIGNPPYLEYSKVKDYSVRNYSTDRCANLYAYTVERSSALCSSKGRTGMIIPILRLALVLWNLCATTCLKTSRTLWLSHFSNRPGQLLPARKKHSQHCSRGLKQFDILPVLLRVH